MHIMQTPTGLTCSCKCIFVVASNLDVFQEEQEATDKPISNRPKNISETGYRCVCLNARSIVNKKNELNII